METINIKKWSEYPDQINKIKEKYEIYDTNGYPSRNDILYRGQANYKWTLNTTLERKLDRKWKVNQYLQLTYRCISQIKSYTNKDWNLPSLEEAERIIRERSEDFLIYVPESIYSYWIYLRHHGFPSPLLDWTASPYIAAFFAFAENMNSEMVSIYAYIEHPRGVKSGCSGEPKIKTVGPYIHTHKRHFLQQCWYTIATKPSEDKEHEFASHDEVVEIGNSRQDVLIKINIPSSERFTTLKNLNETNINHFSLFQSEEALMLSLAFNEIDMVLL